MKTSRLHTTIPALRPRERLLSFGAQSLSDQELWMCVLGKGRKGLPVEALASQVITALTLPSANRETATWGAAQLARVLAVEELSLRSRQKNALPIANVASALLLCHDLRQSKTEQMRVLYCSTAAHVLHQQTVALGGLNIAVIQPRDIFFPIRLHPVDSILICHNHPGGTPAPSPEDLVFTRRLQAACELLGIWLRDHVILTAQTHYSFRESGALA